MSKKNWGKGGDGTLKGALGMAMANMGVRVSMGRLGSILDVAERHVNEITAAEVVAQAEAYRRDAEVYVIRAAPLIEQLVEARLQYMGMPIEKEVERDLDAILHAGGDETVAVRVRWVFGRIYCQKAQMAKVPLCAVITELMGRNVLKLLAEGEHPDSFRLTLGDENGIYGDEVYVRDEICRDGIYIPNGGYPVESRKDVKAVFNCLIHLAGVARKEAVMRADCVREAFKADLTGDASDFWAGKEGIYALYVLETSYDRKVRDVKGEEVLDEDGKVKSETIRLPGGRLKVSLTKDGKVSVLDGLGPFDEYVQWIASVPDVFVSLDAVKTNKWWAVSRWLSEDVREATTALQQLFNRAWQAHQKMVEVRAAIEKFKALATISPAEFFHGTIGVACVYHRMFMSGGKTYRYASVLVERGSAGVRLVDSINAEGLFPEACKEFAVEGEQFSEIMFPLKAFLRAAFQKVMVFDEKANTWIPRPPRE